MQSSKKQRAHLICFYQIFIVIPFSAIFCLDLDLPSTVSAGNRKFRLLISSKCTHSQHSSSPTYSLYLYASKLSDGQYCWSLLSKCTFVQVDSELFSFNTGCTHTEEIYQEIRIMKAELDIIRNEFG